MVLDLLFIAVLLAFFALCVGYVKLCDRIIGPEEAAPATVEVDRESVRR